MFFGTHETFDYLECGSCGCLQLTQIPQDISKYYPSEYHQTSHNLSLGDKVKNSAARIAIKTQIKLNRRFIGANTFPASIFFDLPQKTHLSYYSRILEVGCGRGELLKWMRGMGFKNVLGIDPYVAEGNKCDVEIRKDPIDTIPEDGSFDLIIFDHSFEHIFEEAQTLREVKRLLSPKGSCLIRVPIKSEYIWQKYSVNWVQIDGPRHFYLHTQKSLRILADQAQLTIDKTVFDSSEFQFWASEQCLAGIPLRAENSYWVNPSKSIFNQIQMQQYRKQATELNRTQQGDQAAFYLTKK